MPNKLIVSMCYSLLKKDTCSYKHNIIFNTPVPCVTNCDQKITPNFLDHAVKISSVLTSFDTKVLEPWNILLKCSFIPEKMAQFWWQMLAKIVKSSPVAKKITQSALVIEQLPKIRSISKLNSVQRCTFIHILVNFSQKISVIVIQRYYAIQEIKSKKHCRSTFFR